MYKEDDLPHFEEKTIKESESILIQINFHEFCLKRQKFNMKKMNIVQSCPVTNSNDSNGGVSAYQLMKIIKV